MEPEEILAEPIQAPAETGPEEASAGLAAAGPAEDALDTGLDPQLQEGLCILENSQALMRTIFLGLALQYRSLDIQRCQLLAAAEDPEAEFCGIQPRSMQGAAALITLCALFGFQSQAQMLACQTARDGGCADMTDVKLNAVVILIALIRLIRLARPEPAAQNAEPGEIPEAGELEELEELEELAEPVI